MLLCLPLLFTTCKKEDNMPTADLAIGDTHQGGVVFYLDATGQHGFVCDFQDLGTTEWGCHDTLIPAADGTGIGKGYQNTIDIEAGCTKANTAPTGASISAMAFSMDTIRAVPAE